MRTVDDFPFRIQEEPNVEIPMSDGIRLAARVWRPRDAGPVPAILEYIPYRKRFGTAARDARTHPYLAGRGYAAVRVDLRGSGESSGVLTDEYLPTELQDGVEVIEWLASQPWCDGNVGMMGISWGGFNALQIAALQPEPLKAIVTACSTDDRYADDVHYMGGCLLTENLSWASVMFAFNTMPPDPLLVGDGWRGEWLRRLEESGLWLETWLRHQRRDDYWRHGSICEDYSAVEVPVYAVSGWADAYSNAALRLAANLDAPTKVLVGPWSHVYPHMGDPGPAIGFLQELVRWWDHWLKGTNTGIMDEPPIRLWMQDSVPPATAYSQRPGRWITEDSWPPTRVRTATIGLDARGALREDPGDGIVTGASPLWVGHRAGKWCSYVGPPDLPGEQRHEDAGSWVFDTEPLEDPIEVLGAPVLEALVTVDRPIAQLVARLSDVQPDGSATRVSYGVLNLTHRDSHERPEPLQPGTAYRVRLQLNDIAQRFQRGHRIRLALSTSYWPLIWPAPEPVALTVDCEASRLLLPMRPQTVDEDRPAPFDPPEGAPQAEITVVQPPRHSWEVTHDLGSDVHRLEVLDDGGVEHHLETGLVVERRTKETYSIDPSDPCTAAGEVTTERSMSRADWSIATRTHTRLTATEGDFRVAAELEAVEGGEVVYHRRWDVSIPRDHL